MVITRVWNKSKSSSLAKTHDEQFPRKAAISNTRGQTIKRPILKGHCTRVKIMWQPWERICMSALGFAPIKGSNTVKTAVLVPYAFIYLYDSKPTILSPVLLLYKMPFLPVSSCWSLFITNMTVNVHILFCGWRVKQIYQFTCSNH